MIGVSESLSTGKCLLVLDEVLLSEVWLIHLYFKGKIMRGMLEVFWCWCARAAETESKSMIRRRTKSAVQGVGSHLSCLRHGVHDSFMSNIDADVQQSWENKSESVSVLHSVCLRWWSGYTTQKWGPWSWQQHHDDTRMYAAEFKRTRIVIWSSASAVPKPICHPEWLMETLPQQPCESQVMQAKALIRQQRCKTSTSRWSHSKGINWSTCDVKGISTSKQWLPCMLITSLD